MKFGLFCFKSLYSSEGPWVSTAECLFALILRWWSVGSNFFPKRWRRSWASGVASKSILSSTPTSDLRTRKPWTTIVYYIVPRSLLNDDVTFAQQHHGEALMIYCYGTTVSVPKNRCWSMCTSGVTPSWELAKKSMSSKMYIFLRKKSPVVGRSQAGTAGAHT